MFLLDTSFFGEAANRHYPTVVFGNFWQALGERLGTDIFLTQRVKKAVSDDDDLVLKGWLEECVAQKAVLSESDELTQDMYSDIASDLYASDYTPSALDTFFNGPAPWVVAKAAAHGHRVVTGYAKEPITLSRVGFANICGSYKVQTVNIIGMLNELDIKFGYGEIPKAGPSM